MRLLRTAVPLFALLAVIHTWPLARDAASHAVDLGDGILNTWLLTAVAQRLAAHPLSVFDVNMYYPYRHALATLDHQISAAVLVAPIGLATGNAVLADNIFILASFVMAGTFMAMLVARLTGSRAAALVAGCIYAFSTMRLENLNRPHVLGNCWLPLALLMLHRYVTAPTWRRLAAATTSFLCLALASWYYTLIGAIALTLAAVGDLVQARTQALRIVVRALPAIVVIGLVLAAVARPYLAISREYFPQPLPHAYAPSAPKAAADDGSSLEKLAVNADVIQSLAASVENYLAAGNARAPWMAPLRSVSRMTGARYFPGFVALVFAAVAVLALAMVQLRTTAFAWPAVVLSGLAAFAVVAAGLDLPAGPIALVRGVPWFFALLCAAWVSWLVLPLRARDEQARQTAVHVRTYLVIAIVGLMLSLGERVRAFGVPLGAGIYPASVPPFDFLRASSRLGALFSLGVAALAGFGVAAVQRRLSSRRLSMAVCSCALLLVNAELFTAPLQLQRVGAMPDVYAFLKRAPAGPVADFPIHGNPLALLWSLQYRQPIINGGGALQPAAFHRLEEHDDLSPAMLAHLRAYLHPRYIVVNRASYPGERGQALERALADDRDELTLIGHFGTHDLFEVTGPSRGPMVLRAYPAGTVDGARTAIVHASIEGSSTRAIPALQVWGNGTRLATADAGSLNSDRPIVAPLQGDMTRGLDLEVLADYTLRNGAGALLGRTGRAAAADIVLTVSPERTRLQVNGRVWIGDKGYTVVTIRPDGQVAGARTFNTSWSQDDAHALASYVNGLPAGTTVAIASAFDASRSLTDDAVRALGTLGFTGDLRGHFQWAHAGIGVKGAASGTVVESIGESTADARVGDTVPFTVVLKDVVVTDRTDASR